MEKDNPTGWKALIAAAVVGVEIQVPIFNFPQDSHQSEFLKKSPLGKVPLLETERGCLSESNAICRYIARLGKNNLYGADSWEAGQIEQWIEWTTSDVVLPASVWLFPVLGIIPNNPTATQKAKADIRKACEILNKHLEGRKFLVGSSLSLADIVVSMTFYRLYVLVLDPGFRQAFVHANQWFETLVGLPEFVKVIGSTVLCQKMAPAKEFSQIPKPELKKSETAKPEKTEKKPEKKPVIEPQKPKEQNEKSGKEEQIFE